jgi:MFS family permease
VQLLGNRAFVRLCVACFVYFTGIGVGVPVLPAFILGPAGGTTLQVGAAVAVFSLASLVLRPLVVPVARRVAPPLLMAGGALLVGCADAVLILDPGANLVVVVRAIGGAGEAMFFVLASSAVYDLVPAGRQGAAMSYFSAFLSAGLLGSPVVGELMRVHMGYDAVWAMAFALCAIAAAMTASLRIPRLSARRAGSGLRLVHPAAIGPGLLLAVNTWAGAAFSTFTALYVTHLGLGGAAPEFAVFGIVLLGVRVVGARLLDRVNPRRTGGVALALQAGALAAIAMAHTRPLLLIASTVLAVGAAFAYPALMSLAVRSVPDDERTEAVATATACFDAGFAVATLALAAALQLEGYAAVYGLAAGVTAAGALVLAVRRAPVTR